MSQSASARAWRSMRASFSPSLISLATQDWSRLLLPVFRDMPERSALPPACSHVGGWLRTDKPSTTLIFLVSRLFAIPEISETDFPLHFLTPKVPPPAPLCSFLTLCSVNPHSPPSDIFVAHIHQQLNKSLATPSGSSFAGGLVKAPRFNSLSPRTGRSSR